MKKTFKTEREAVDFGNKKLSEANNNRSVSAIVYLIDDEWIAEWSFFKIKKEKIRRLTND